jgi:hypothetical protein
MNRILLATAIGLSFSISSTAYAATPTDFSAASKRGNAYAAKKAECKREAKARKFGIHFVERNRWINDCIAGHRS